jgi:hypothetical protein
MAPFEFHLEYIEPLTTEYIYTDQIKEDEMGENIALKKEKSNPYIVLVENPERKRYLGRPRPRCENNIRIYLREIR